VSRVREWWDGKARGLRSLARIAPNLREPVRFSLRQVARRTGVRGYGLRGANVKILVRHSTGDVITLEEVLADGQYEPPPELAHILDGEPPAVVDLGANIGLFSAWVLAHRPDARIVAFEPDPANANVFEQWMRVNHAEASCQLVRACAAPEAGELRFVTGEFAASRQADGAAGADVAVLPAVDAFPYMQQADFLKIDIEGGEWALLADPRFAGLRPRALVLEYHPHLCPEPDPRACAERLLAGWTLVHRDFAMPPGHGIIWAWR
jgi:FkbM family methyltransferase